MRIVMTMMVRDEADIVSEMIDHHADQGVDHIIVTDNGSVDGTVEILEEYARSGLITLHHDPVQRKQQAAVVTRMAREAATLQGADWVVNADADEFWVPVDRSLRLRDALQQTPTSLRSFLVPVVDMTGGPASAGMSFERLRFRDNRTLDELHRVGLLAHSTPDAVHVGDPDVVVAQGNHAASLASHGDPDPAYALEVLHLPWRSWAQFERKVRNAGMAYESSPELRPSPNHHGMRDYRRLQDGTLFAWYVLRHPSVAGIEAGLADGTFVEDRTLADRMVARTDDVPIDDARLDEVRTLATNLADREAQIAELRTQTTEIMISRLDEARNQLESSEAELERMRNRRSVRLLDRIARLRRRLPG